MIVTKSWLNEFVEIEDVSSDRLYEVFNAIGLEVDSINEISIPDGVVVGRIESCEKHPNADKLNVCQVDVGYGIKQIVCGASNVVDAEFVAVATVGTTLGEDFHIKPAELRGIKSDGMICSSGELGLPDIGDGIMMLDDSIGTLKVGRSLNQYPKVADTVIELELTANRGDCLSIRGVARDLSAALQRDFRMEEKRNLPESNRIATAKALQISNSDNLPIDMLYKLAESNSVGQNILINLRLGFVELELGGRVSNVLSYSTHATGVILRAYDADKLQGDNQSISMNLSRNENGLIEIECQGKLISIVGVSQDSEFMANDDSGRIIFGATYIKPESIIEGVVESGVESDALYYKTSRGSEPDLKLGFAYLEESCREACSCEFADSYVKIDSERRAEVVSVNFSQLDAIIGQEISRSLVSGILSRLGFDMKRSRSSDSFGAEIPAFRHDITNIQDIAEEVLRIVGINNIAAKPLELIEKVRLTNSTLRYKAKRDIRNRAVAEGFYEAVTYAFSDRVKLEKYGFSTVDESVKLLNPIAEEFNEMRSTILINLLDSVKRNRSYGIKRVPLFEIGTVFGAQREESEKIAFVWSGNLEQESMLNSAKSKKVDFASFVERVSSVIGDFELKTTEPTNRLMHPYQSADIVIDGDVIGYISKLHLEVASDFGIDDTFIAELELGKILPKHIDAKPISNYQGVHKDISVVVDKDVNYSDLASSIWKIDSDILRSYAPIDVYSDEELGEKKSVTLRLFIQSFEGTMSEKMIDGVVQSVLELLSEEWGAVLR